MPSDANLQLAQQEYDGEYWKQTDKDIISGHWIIEIEENQEARFYCDKVALTALELPTMVSPEDYYKIWQENIFSSHIAEMQRHVNAIVQGEQGDITYPWKSPSGNTLYIRSIGMRDMRYQKGIRLVGTFQEVTSIIFSEHISRRTYLKSDYLLQILADTFEAVHVIQFNKGTIMPVRAIMPLFWNEHTLDIPRYLELMEKFLPPQDCEHIQKCIVEQMVFDHAGNRVTKYSWDFKSDALKKDGWYNILLSLDPNVSKEDMIVAVRDISELENNKNTINTLKHISEMDGLTHIFNRAAIEAKIEQHILENPQEAGLVMLLDMDNFKQVNDVFGHMEGDQFLIALAEKLQSYCRSTDTVSRLGGDEFMIFMRSVKNEDVDPLVRRIIRDIRKEYCREDLHFAVTASVGVAHYPEDGSSFAELYHCADLALYEAKHRGKNCCAQYRDIAK